MADHSRKPWALILALGTIVPATVHQMIPGSAQAPVSPLTPKTANPRTGFNPISLTGIPAGQLTDRDPKLAIIKTFGARESARPEGLRSESLEVLYLEGGKAVATMIVDGLSDDSVRATKLRIELQLVRGRWQINWAGSQVKCLADRGHSDWSNQPCN
ncbi:hypothetical protein BST81_12840 [Leptolyngbya sp. 'hensonii']|uniref:hypothetical protein n=1 Tax=Leptolyngbya sp. 'hensonii' TaxID=1922337 RepID=UPI00094FDBF2|nr:hypothetical protein [Leptolyngbya sp. 'hensonii']OLP17937.1 hypothetical protein BST81_12840 [Leptolyngbya sp. 'hensonii']